MAIRNEADDQPIHKVLLPDDGSADLVAKRLHPRRGFPHALGEGRAPRRSCCGLTVVRRGAGTGLYLRFITLGDRGVARRHAPGCVQ
ncbi:MAG: hypothetical protein H0U23_01820 [Blastocatellia bacterium]|nr:hypothetical protein [Blastocatellia bacterium]